MGCALAFVNLPRQFADNHALRIVEPLESVAIAPSPGGACSRMLFTY